MNPVTVAPPKPVEGEAVIYAAKQPEYKPLPAWKTPDAVISRWRLTWRERLRVLLGRDLYVEVLTFGGPLQPIYMTWAVEEMFE